VSKLLQKIEYVILVVSLSVMSIITFANVIARYFLNIALGFSEEITLNLFVLLTFVGASVGIHRRAHLAFDALLGVVKGYWKLGLVLFVGAITTILFAIICYFGIKIVMFQYNISLVTPSLGWPQWVFTSGLALGSLLCVIRSIQVTAIEVRNILKNGSDPA
jgi:TRAP-type C4-dicarboxylate transport system permease small subunit